MNPNVLLAVCITNPIYDPFFSLFYDVFVIEFIIISVSVSGIKYSLSEIQDY